LAGQSGESTKSIVVARVQTLFEISAVDAHLVEEF
jgi:hypothetical protein